ncbi:unnamed protein product [Mytilus coruscus]|uniref:Uncharacterized protein n=1 Tax=Mytilus coruscus TaxID=42192 RepID=A0A6J8CUY6_MYTCO|nr:unnamed protein product [Mytilus coruscus]
MGCKDYFLLSELKLVYSKPNDFIKFQGIRIFWVAAAAVPSSERGIRIFWVAAAAVPSSERGIRIFWVAAAAASTATAAVPSCERGIRIFWVAAEAAASTAAAAATAFPFIYTTDLQTCNSTKQSIYVPISLSNGSAAAATQKIRIPLSEKGTATAVEAAVATKKIRIPLLEEGTAAAAAVEAAAVAAAAAVVVVVAAAAAAAAHVCFSYVFEDHVAKPKRFDIGCTETSSPFLTTYFEIIIPQDEFDLVQFVSGYFECGYHKLYIVWRIFWALYHLVWIILTGVYSYQWAGDDPAQQVKWFIYLTNWAYFVLTFSTTIGAVCVVYIAFKRDDILQGACSDMPWYLKVDWVFFNVSNSVSILVTMMYWGLIYTSK